jgi:ABC-2 type transport system permease protein
MLAALSYPRKIWAIFGIYLMDCFAYPAASFIWVVADAQTAIILPVVWMATGVGTIAGMDNTHLITYYIASMTISQFVTCYLMWDISWDIREGFVTSFLIKPFPFFAFNVGRNFSWRVAKLALFLPLIFLVYYCYLGSRPTSPLHFTGEFWASLALAHTLSFVAGYWISMVAFWTVEFFSILRLYLLIELLLSGRLFPTGAMPGWAQSLANTLHFRYTNAFPVDVLMGQCTHAEIIRGLWIQFFWCVFFLVLGKIFFDRGVRRYTGVGM